MVVGEVSSRTSAVALKARSVAKRRLGPDGVARVKRAVAPLLTGDLTRLGRFYGTNKAHDNAMFMPHYERHLKARRKQPLCILEIGVGGYVDGTGGSSLRMWRTYFPKARVFGIDIEPRDLHEPRIQTFCGDQSDREFLARVIDEIGSPDLIIDDGSHQAAHVTASFEFLFPYIATGGIYVIEDLQFSYRSEWGGGPPGTTGTAVELVKQLVDPLAQRRVSHGAEAALHVYPRIAFIEKR